MHFNGLKLSCALKEFSITFLGFKNAKNNFVENKGFDRIVFQIEVQVI